MPITLLDGILLGVAVISGLLAMVRGFSREVLSIVSWVVAAIAAFMFYAAAVPFVQNYIASELVATLVAAAGIFLVTLIVVTYITMRIADFIIDSRIGPLDRTLGFLFGVARGGLLMVVAMLFFNFLVAPEQTPSWVADAKSRPLLENLGESLVDALPDDPEEAIRQRLGNGAEEAAALES